MRRILFKERFIRGRVLHLSTAHPWSDNRIHWREAVSLSSAGYDVGLYALAAEDDNATPVRLTQVSPQPRLKRMSLGTVRALRVAIRSSAEIVHVHDPELIWAIPILRFAGHKVIYDAHEDLPAQIVDKPYLAPSLAVPMSWVAKGLVAVANRASSAVIAATDTISQRFDKSKTTVVRNFPHAPSGDRAQLDVSERAHSAVYVGGLSHNRGGQVMVDAFDSDNIPEGWQLFLAGRPLGGYLETLESRPGWKRVQYSGKVSPAEARRLISSSRVGIVTLRETAAYRDSLPTKMFEYMADGVAIIASDFPLWRSIIERFDCGVLVDQDSPDAVAEAIARYASDPALLRRHSQNGMRAAKQWLNWENEATELLAAYERVLES